jgi:hypothetical protein
MYSETDLQQAVDAKVISAESADALRIYVGRLSDASPADEEHFRLVTGFNDIFVTIAIFLVLGSIVAICLQSLPGATGAGTAGLVVAAISWPLAEFFTLRRRMALPSIVLALTLVGGVAVGVSAGSYLGSRSISDTGPLAGALAAAGAALAHWFRFRVPITMAAALAALAFALFIPLGLIVALFYQGDQAARIAATMIVLGLGILGIAMRWDISDPLRTTRRSDVAFWLHLLAAPLIVHPLFLLIGVSLEDKMGGAQAVMVLLLYLVFATISVAIDRRAFLVSALAYVLFAVGVLFRQAGSLNLQVALTTLIVGAGLLALSAFWSSARKRLIGHLPVRFTRLLPPAV